MLPPPRFLVRHPRMERWVSTVWRDWARLMRPRWGVERRFGRDLLIDQTCPVGRGMLTRGLWEFRQIERLATEMRARGAPRDTVFLDVGAFWGLYSLWLERHRLANEIHAIEPSPVNRAHLRTHLAMNKLNGRIQVHSFAASDREGTAQFIESGGVSRIGAGAVEVPTRPLDDVFDFQDRLLVLKIDTEGHERVAIDGMARLLGRNRVLMQVEVFPENQPDVLGRLQALGLAEVARMGDEFFYATPD